SRPKKFGLHRQIDRRSQPSRYPFRLPRKMGNSWSSWRCRACNIGACSYLSKGVVNEEGVGKAQTGKAYLNQAMVGDVVMRFQFKPTLYLLAVFVLLF